MAKILTGANCSTKENFALGKGIFLKNFHFKSETPEEALAAGKCIGATQGGGNFTATPTTRNVPIDGISDIIELEKWEITMSANVIEFKPETIKDALGSGVLTKDNNYWKIQAKNEYLPGDYAENITFVGWRKGDSDPYLIQIFSAISTSGLNFSLAPNSEIITAITWTASTDSCLDNSSGEFAAFAIYIPIAVPRVTVDKVFVDSTTITGIGIAGSTVKATGGTLTAAATAITGGDGKFSINITEQALGAKLTLIQEIDGQESLETFVYVQESLTMSSPAAFSARTIKIKSTEEK